MTKDIKLVPANSTLNVYCSTLTSVNESFTFGGLPLGLPVIASATAVEPLKPPVGRAIFLGRPLGFPLPEGALTLGGFGGASASLGGRPLGLPDDKLATSGWSGSLGLGGLPRPRLGGAFGSGFV